MISSNCYVLRSPITICAPRCRQPARGYRRGLQPPSGSQEEKQMRPEIEIASLLSCCCVRPPAAPVRQAGALGPTGRPLPFKCQDDGAGEDATGSKITGSYNNWRLELNIDIAGGGGGTALRLAKAKAFGNRETCFLDSSWDNAGEVAMGRLFMISDIVRTQRQKDPCPLQRHV